jgi:UDP-N-acetylglucosamine:LPS N-acetylglucosamine transferase
VVAKRLKRIESQNYLAMADLVISKSGYSTVSEAMCAHVPL